MLRAMGWMDANFCAVGEVIRLSFKKSKRSVTVNSFGVAKSIVKLAWHVVKFIIVTKITKLAINQKSQIIALHLNFISFCINIHLLSLTILY